MARQAGSRGLPSVLTLPLSGAVRIGDIVAVSGQAGFDDAGNLLKGIEAQTRRTLEIIQQQLEGAGATMEDVIMMRVYLAHKSGFPAMNEVYAEFFNEPYPARTTVFPDLYDDILIEIDALAVVSI